MGGGGGCPLPPSLTCSTVGPSVVKNIETFFRTQAGVNCFCQPLARVVSGHTGSVIHSRQYLVVLIGCFWFFKKELTNDTITAAGVERIENLSVHSVMVSLSTFLAFSGSRGGISIHNTLVLFGDGRAHILWLNIMMVGPISPFFTNLKRSFRWWRDFCMNLCLLTTSLTILHLRFRDKLFDNLPAKIFLRHFLVSGIGLHDNDANVHQGQLSQTKEQLRSCFPFTTESEMHLAQPQLIVYIDSPKPFPAHKHHQGTGNISLVAPSTATDSARFRPEVGGCHRYE